MLPGALYDARNYVYIPMHPCIRNDVDTNGRKRRFLELDALQIRFNANEEFRSRILIKEHTFELAHSRFMESENDCRIHEYESPIVIHMIHIITFTYLIYICYTL